MAVSGSGAKGDGTIAKEILDLREKLLFKKYNEYEFDDEGYVYEENKISLTIDDFYRDLILKLGLERQDSRDMAQNQTMLIKQIDERKREISTVSLDEEMANMLKYQHSYIANAG